MEYMYAAMLLHSAGKDINEDSIGSILSAAGISPDTVRIKALVAALAEVDIDEALKAPVLTAAAPSAVHAVDEEQLVAGTKPAGEHFVEWDAKGLPSGIYFYRLVVGDFTQTRKMILLK